MQKLQSRHSADFSRSSLTICFDRDNDDTLTASSGEGFDGRMYGGSGDDKIRAGGEVDFDVWGGPGNDRIEGSSECVLDRSFGGSGNDEFQQPGDFTRAGSGNDLINFFDCGGTAYGDSGNDKINGGDAGIEAHGGSGDDELKGGCGDNDLFGGSGDDTLTGGDCSEPNHFDCGPGIDTITNFDA
jgi:Ca2+-binding RTX toxin-like protein